MPGISYSAGKMNDQTRFELGRVRKDLDFLSGQLSALDLRIASLEKDAATEAEPAKPQRTEILERLSKPAQPATPPPLPTVPKPAGQAAKKSAPSPETQDGAPSNARRSNRPILPRRRNPPSFKPRPRSQNRSPNPNPPPQLPRNPNLPSPHLNLRWAPIGSSASGSCCC